MRAWSGVALGSCCASSATGLASSAWGGAPPGRGAGWFCTGKRMFWRPCPRPPPCPPRPPRHRLAKPRHALALGHGHDVLHAWAAGAHGSAAGPAGRHHRHARSRAAAAAGPSRRGAGRSTWARPGRRRRRAVVVRACPRQPPPSARTAPAASSPVLLALRGGRRTRGLLPAILRSSPVTARVASSAEENATNAEPRLREERRRRFREERGGVSDTRRGGRARAHRKP